jgi:hypothetical protein
MKIEKSEIVKISLQFRFYEFLAAFTCSEWKIIAVIKLKSLILAQIERWRHALHMQVER